MKIAIGAEGEGEDARVSPVGGRASYYLIFEDGTLVKTMKNPFKAGGGGAGFGVAEMLSDEGVNLVVSGNFGEKMIGAMTEKGMKYTVLSEMTVAEALQETTNN